MSIENIKQDELVSVLRRLLFGLSEGSLLSVGMKGFPNVFPALHTQIIGIGEKTGTLDKSLIQIVELTKERMEIEKKAVEASSYPLFLMGVSSTMVIGMIMFVFPQFKDIFESFGSKLPALTQFLMDLSKHIGDNKALVFGGFGATVFGVIYFVKAPSLSETRETILLKVPLVKDVFISMFISQLTKTLSSTLKSGIPLLDSLMIAHRTIPLGARRDFIEMLIHSVREGELMSVAMQRVEWVPELVWQLTSVGEKTGNLGVIMDNLFFFYKRKYSDQMDKMMGVMKPALMFGSAAVIGTMAGALFIPLFKMGTNMKRGG